MTVVCYTCRPMRSLWLSTGCLNCSWHGRDISPVFTLSPVSQLLTDYSSPAGSLNQPSPTGLGYSSRATSRSPSSHHLRTGGRQKEPGAGRVNRGQAEYMERIHWVLIYVRLVSSFAACVRTVRSVLFKCNPWLSRRLISSVHLVLICLAFLLHTTQIHS